MINDQIDEMKPRLLREVLKLLDVCEDKWPKELTSSLFDDWLLIDLRVQRADQVAEFMNSELEE